MLKHIDLKKTTIPQGCKKLGKGLNEVIKKLREVGFEVSL